MQLFRTFVANSDADQVMITHVRRLGMIGDVLESECLLESLRYLIDLSIIAFDRHGYVYNVFRVCAPTFII